MRDPLARVLDEDRPRPRVELRRVLEDKRHEIKRLDEIVASFETVRQSNKVVRERNKRLKSTSMV